MKIKVISAEKKGNYTKVSNTIWSNKDLSYEAQCFFVRVLALHPNWDFSIKGMAVVTGRPDKWVSKIIKELIAQGYCTSKKGKDARGKYAQYEYTFIEHHNDNGSKVNIILPKEAVFKLNNQNTESDILINDSESTTQGVENQVVEYQNPVDRSLENHLVELDSVELDSAESSDNTNTELKIKNEEAKVHSSSSNRRTRNENLNFSEQKNEINNPILAEDFVPKSSLNPSDPNTVYRNEMKKASHEYKNNEIPIETCLDYYLNHSGQALSEARAKHQLNNGLPEHEHLASWAKTFNVHLEIHKSVFSKSFNDWISHFSSWLSNHNTESFHFCPADLFQKPPYKPYPKYERQNHRNQYGRAYSKWVDVSGNGSGDKGSDNQYNFGDWDNPDK